MIPINLIRQYFFCPRIVYYNLLTNIKPFYPLHVNMGLEFHKMQTKLSKNRKFQKLKIDFEYILMDKYFEDEKLGICGKVDLALICKDEIVPIEFKFANNKKPAYSHILQLFGYGKLLSDNFDKDFKQAVIIYDKYVKIFKIQITKKLEQDFLNTLNKIKQIKENNLLPQSSASEAKCTQCEYINYCDDRI